MPEQSSKPFEDSQQQAAEVVADDHQEGGDTTSASSGGNNGNGENNAGTESVLTPGSAGGSEFAARVRALPLARWSADAYGLVAACPYLAPQLRLLECAVGLGAMPLRVLAQPLSRMCPAPFRAADWLLCRGLDAVETVCPCISTQPGQIPRQCANKMVNCVCFVPRTFNDIMFNWYRREINWHG